MLRGGFCFPCNLEAENSYNCYQDAYSFYYTSNNSNYYPQPQYENYLCNLCGNNSHDGYDCQQQFSFVYEQEPSYNQNYNANYYPHDLPSFPCCDNCGGSHETFQCQPMDQNIDFFGSNQIQTPQYPDVHLPSQEKSEKVSQAKEDLMKSIETFLEKFNCIPFEEKPPILLQAWFKFFAIQYSNPENPNELFQKLLEDLKELAEYKESLENSSKEIVVSSSNQEKEEPVQDSDILAPILSTKEPEHSLTIGYEHLSITPETESDEVIESNAENLLPIPSECEDDDISVYDDDFKDIEYVEASLPDPEIVSVEEENEVEEEEFDNSLSDTFSPEFETFCDHTEETRSGNTTHAENSLPEYDSFCFEIEPDQERLIYVVKNDISDDSSNDPLLEEAELFLPFDNSIPSESENMIFDPDAETDAGEEIPVVINDKDKFDEYYYFFMFSKVFSLLTAESEDTIFDPRISV
nr:hypothetical protein [Tanacetum cinerariifolium]